MIIDIKNKSLGSVLDFPRKKLPETLWDYNDPNDLPQLNPSLRTLIISTAKNYLLRYNLELYRSMIYGGAASYQWSEGADIDVSLYAKGWSEDIKPDEIEFIQEQFKNIELPFEGYPIHFFLKPPTEGPEEVADAVYDITEDEWILPPLILPENFDPDEYFAPLIKVAETKAKKFDAKIGKLKRAWKILEKSAESKREAKEPKIVEKRIKAQKEKIKALVSELADTFYAIREKRYAMHDKLRDKMHDNVEVGRFERFQEPEIVWKYLDRSGYNDFLWKIYKIDQAKTIDNILAKY